MLALTTTTKCSYIFWLYSELKSNANQFSKFYPKNSVWGIVKWFSVSEFLQFIRKTPSAANHNYKANKKRPPCVKRIKNQVDCVYGYDSRWQYWKHNSMWYQGLSCSYRPFYADYVFGILHSYIPVAFNMLKIRRQHRSMRTLNNFNLSV